MLIFDDEPAAWVELPDRERRQKTAAPDMPLNSEYDYERDNG